MAITYPVSDTTPQLKFARMIRRKKRIIQLHNVMGLWRQFSSNRWYIVKHNMPEEVGTGWKGNNTFHLKKVRISGVASYATKAEADAAFATLTNQVNKAVGQFGLTQAMYDSLPLSVRNTYPFSNRLSANNWLTAKTWLTKRRRRINTELLIQEALVENDATGDDAAADV